MARMLEQEATDDFGCCLSYDKAFFSQLNGKPVSVEKYHDGEFQKYINNNGDFEPNKDEVFLKAETFMHYSYKKSGEFLMITDIQGFGFSLTDPEIATTEPNNSDNKWNFCAGNCSLIAITNFLGNHSCNRFCKLLNL